MNKGSDEFLEKYPRTKKYLQENALDLDQALMLTKIELEKLEGKNKS